MVNEMRRGRRGGTARTSSGALCVHLEHEDEEGEQEKETAQGLREGEDTRAHSYGFGSWLMRRGWRGHRAQGAAGAHTSPSIIRSHTP